LALHHLARAFGVIGAESEDLGGLFQAIIQQVLQLTQLRRAGASPKAAVHDQNNILASVL
jgi:hypothetical protein